VLAVEWGDRLDRQIPDAIFVQIGDDGDDRRIITIAGA
jgi:hypothetical protein